MLKLARPRIVAAQRLQLLLLITAVTAVTLGAVLVSDLVTGMRSVAISEAENSLTAALHDLIQAHEHWERESVSMGSERTAEADDLDLRLVSYTALQPHTLVEGGYFRHGSVLGHSFPEHTEPGSQLLQPDVEKKAMLAAIEESRLSGKVAHRVVTDRNDLVVVSALAPPGMETAAWGLKRFISFSDPGQARHQLILIILIGVSLLSITGVLVLSFRLQRGFAEIKSGLHRMRDDIGYRIPEQNHELQTIAQAINQMAEARQWLESVLRREDQLRLMGRMVAGIAHEIKNPLNSIRIMAQALRRMNLPAEETQETTDSIVQELDRLNTLLNSLLMFRGDQPANLRVQPIRPVIERCLSIAAPQAAEKQIRLVSQSDGDATSAVDADYLQQAVMNLLLNALDAAGERGTVSVETCSQNGRIVIQVADSGPGLSPEEAEKVFEAFYTTKLNGTGLGLLITKTLIEKMGGSIRYENRRSGTAFAISLPRS